MIPGIEDDPEPKPAPPVAPAPTDNRPMVRLSLGFYHYLQECADFVAGVSTDPRPMTRRLCLEWRLGAREIQISHGKHSE